MKSSVNKMNIVSKLGLAGTFILLSSNSFAGIFCSDKFECDLTVSDFVESKAVFSSKVSREGYAIIFDPMSSGGKKEDLANKNGKGVHIAAIGSREALINKAYSAFEGNPDMVMGKVDGVIYKNCKASKGSLDKLMITLTVDCDKYVSTTKMTGPQKVAAMCVQAQLCAANIRDPEQIKDYMQLRDAVCANKDSVSGSEGNSTGRNHIKAKEGQSGLAEKLKAASSR